MVARLRRADRAHRSHAVGDLLPVHLRPDQDEKRVEVIEAVVLVGERSLGGWRVAQACEEVIEGAAVQLDFVVRACGAQFCQGSSARLGAELVSAGGLRRRLHDIARYERGDVTVGRPGKRAQLRLIETAEDRPNLEQSRHGGSPRDSHHRHGRQTTVMRSIAYRSTT